eukprot:Pgem_evm1s19743
MIFNVKPFFTLFSIMSISKSCYSASINTNNLTNTVHNPASTPKQVEAAKYVLHRYNNETNTFRLDSETEIVRNCSVTEIIRKVEKLVNTENWINVQVNSILTRTTIQSEKTTINSACGDFIYEDFFSNRTHTETYGIATHVKTGITVVHTLGTADNPRDSNSNFQTSTSSCFGIPGKIHSGWCGEFSHIKQRLETTLKRLKPTIKKLAFFGHSQGAAVAAIEAAYFLTQGFKVDILFTHGTPRVGNQVFTNYLMQNIAYHKRFLTTHHDYHNDYIAYFPPKDIKVFGKCIMYCWGYTDLGEPTYLKTPYYGFMSLHMESMNLLDTYRDDENFDVLLGENNIVDRSIKIFKTEIK